jgi:single-strand DNA-binding protein
MPLVKLEEEIKTMINQCVLVGKVKELPEVRTTSKGNTVADLILETDRSFRSDDGQIGTDCFKVVLWRGIAEETASIVKVGDLIGVKGRLQASVREKEGLNFYNCEVIAEKVSFLSARMAAAA